MFGSSSGSSDTILSTGAEIKGNLNIKGSIRIYGRVEGNIQAEETVELGESGSVKGNIYGRHIVIGGKVHGHIVSTERAELLPTAVVDGDIKTPKLTMAEGCLFEGSCEMDQSQADPLVVAKAKK